MFNKRRTKSAYLGNDNGKIKSIEPDSASYKMKRKIVSHKKDIKLNVKKIIMVICFCICCFLFYQFLDKMIVPLYTTMNVTTEDTKFQTWNEKLKNWNKKTKEQMDTTKLEMINLTNSVNGYNSEIASLYETVKSTYTIFQNKKEGVYNTQKLIDSTIERIDLDIAIVEKDIAFTDYPTLKNLYLTRLQTLKTLLEKGITATMIHDFNETIIDENQYYQNCLNETESILQNNNIPYQLNDGKFEF